MSFYYPLAGGLIVGSCVHHLLYFNGNVLGISGIYSASVRRILGVTGGKEVVRNEAARKQSGAPDGAANGTADKVRSRDEIEATKGVNEPSSENGDWQLAFTAGLFAGGLLLRVLRPYLERKLGIPLFEDAAVKALSASPLVAFIGGALVGLGTKLAGGCTSGHMLCGVSRLSLRSIIATLTFFSTAVAVVKFNPSPSVSTSPSVGISSVDIPTLLLLQLPLLLYRYIIPATVPKRYYNQVSSFFVALHFSFGLALAGMLQPSKIQNFLALPFSPSFDPSLAFVAIGGLLPNMISWSQWIRKTAKPVYGNEFDLPTKKYVDWRLIVGSMFFGIGWGLLGICPGPGLVVLPSVFGENVAGIGSWVLGLSAGGLLVPFR